MFKLVSAILKKKEKENEILPHYQNEYAADTGNAEFPRDVDI